MCHYITLQAQRRHHSLMPNQHLRQRGLHHLRLSPQSSYELLRHCSNSRTIIHENIYLSSRGRTGNRKTPCDMSAPSNAVRRPPYQLSYRRTRQAARPNHATTKWCWIFPATAATRVPAAAPELIEGLVRHFAAQRSEKHGAAPSRCTRYPLVPPSPG